jgi:hypothetical protein
MSKFLTIAPWTVTFYMLLVLQAKSVFKH